MCMCMYVCGFLWIMQYVTSSWYTDLTILFLFLPTYLPVPAACLFLLLLLLLLLLFCSLFAAVCCYRLSSALCCKSQYWPESGWNPEAMIWNFAIDQYLTMACRLVINKLYGYSVHGLTRTFCGKCRNNKHFWVCLRRTCARMPTLVFEKLERYIWVGRGILVYDNNGNGVKVYNVSFCSLSGLLWLIEENFCF